MVSLLTSSLLISWVLVPLLHLGMIWLHLGLYSCWLIYWLNNPSRRKRAGSKPQVSDNTGREYNKRLNTTTTGMILLGLCYLSQPCRWAPRRHQNLPVGPVGHAGEWAWDVLELFESSSVATRRPLCSYAVGSVWGKGGWLPVLCTVEKRGHHLAINSADETWEWIPNRWGAVLKYCKFHFT